MPLPGVDRRAVRAVRQHEDARPRPIRVDGAGIAGHVLFAQHDHVELGQAVGDVLVRKVPDARLALGHASSSQRRSQPCGVAPCSACGNSRVMAGIDLVGDGTEVHDRRVAPGRRDVVGAQGRGDAAQVLHAAVGAVAVVEDGRPSAPAAR